jgi:hypothetical protein
VTQGACICNLATGAEYGRIERHHRLSAFEPAAPASPFARDLQHTRPHPHYFKRVLIESANNRGMLTLGNQVRHPKMRSLRQAT